jgi:predicted permease
MLEVLLQMAGLILCGIGWRLFKPAGLDPAPTRKVLTSLVYYLLLPALVLSVLWQAELGERSFQIAAVATAGIALGMLFGVFACRMCRHDMAVTGAVVLAATFPNATYLGLPVLEATFGDLGRSVAIQYDLFACTPLLFTVGVIFAARMGSSGEAGRELYLGLLKIPAMWAAVLAVILNVLDVPLPGTIDGLLELLGRGVVPLMLFSLGLSLEWHHSRWRLLPTLIPVVALRLFLIPLLAWFITSQIGMQGDLQAAVVMEAAMPSMVIGIVLCDRFNLDVSLYAAAVTVTTALSIFTLPMWYGVLSTL